MNKLMLIFVKIKYRAASYAVYLALITFTGLIQAKEQTCSALPISIEPTSITCFLQKIDNIYFSDEELKKRILNGQLAEIYANLQVNLKLANSFKSLMHSNDTLTLAINNLSSQINHIESFYAQYTAENKILGDISVEAQPDVIVILGANKITLEERLNVALPIIEKLNNIPVVLSGAGRGMEEEASFMRDFLLREGKGIIKDSQLIMETDSLDTVGNAVFSALQLHQQRITPKKILLITSNFHAPRALFLFQKIFGEDVRIAALSAPYSGNIRSRVSNEMLSHATSMKEMLQWNIIGAKKIPTEMEINGGCSVLFQMLAQHNLYKYRWDIARSFSNICSIPSNATTIYPK